MGAELIKFLHNTSLSFILLYILLLRKKLNIAEFIPDYYAPAHFSEYTEYRVF
jgi:hypothetical protein